MVVWVPKAKGDKRKAEEIPDEERDYYLERRYPVLEILFRVMSHHVRRNKYAMKVVV